MSVTNLLLLLLSDVPEDTDSINSSVLSVTANTDDFTGMGLHKYAHDVPGVTYLVLTNKYNKWNRPHQQQLELLISYT